MRPIVVLIPNIIEKVDLMPVEKERSSYAMYRRVTPALVNRQLEK